ncbi:MAG: pyridoxamine 5'-phosphate oxidase family protein [Bacteroidia bacterium]
MEFNKVIRGAKRQMNDEKTVFEILDAGFICHVAFQSHGQTMMIPTAYGRKGDIIFLHGSRKNYMMQEILNGQQVCICVTHLDGLVLARNLFHSSVNYRSVVLFGQASLVEDPSEKREALTIISENICHGRTKEVPLGTEEEIESTLTIAFQIESASAKVRTGGPMNDENVDAETWSGVVPLAIHAGQPIPDTKFGKEFPLSESVKRMVN